MTTIIITILTTMGWRSDIEESFRDKPNVTIKTINDYTFKPHPSSTEKLDSIIDANDRDHYYFLHHSDIFGPSSGRPRKIENRCDSTRNIKVYTFSHQATNDFFKMILAGDVDSLIQQQ